MFKFKRNREKDIERVDQVEDQVDKVDGVEKVEDEVDGDEEVAMMAAFEDWLEDAMPEPDRLNSAKTALSSVRKSLLSGNYDEAMFDIIAKGADYDRAVAAAEADGEIKGRNTGIEQFLDPAGLSDGLPHPGACGGSRVNRDEPSIFDLAQDAY